MDINDLDRKIEQLKLTPENAGNGLVQLVLSLINVIRELMEKQALKKIEANELSPEKIEEMGATFLALEEKMNELKEQFNLTDEDLEIDLKKFIQVED
ncbi:MAG: gas vesicle protein K [Cyclobacteriaceae bacterium]